MNTPYNYGNLSVNCQVSIKHKKLVSTQNEEANNRYSEHSVKNNYQHCGDKNVQMYSNICNILCGGSVQNGPNGPKGPSGQNGPNTPKGPNAPKGLHCPSANHMCDKPGEIYHQVHNKAEANRNKRPYVHSQNRMTYGLSEVNEYEKSAAFAKCGSYKDTYTNQGEHFTKCRKKKNVNMVNAAMGSSHTNVTVRGASSCGMPPFINRATTVSPTNGTPTTGSPPSGENPPIGFTQDNPNDPISANKGGNHLMFHDVKSYGIKEIHDNIFSKNCLLNTFESDPKYPFDVPSNGRNTTKNGVYQTGEMYCKEEKATPDEFSSLCFGGNKSGSKVSYEKNSTKQRNHYDDGMITNNSYLTDNAHYDAHQNSIQNVDLLSCKMNPPNDLPISDINRCSSGRSNGSGRRGGLTATRPRPFNDNSSKSPCCFIQFDKNYVDSNAPYADGKTGSEAKMKGPPFLMNYSKVPTSGKAALLDQMEFQHANRNDIMTGDTHPDVKKRPCVGTDNNVIKVECQHMEGKQGQSHNQNMSLKQHICNRDDSHSNICPPLANTYRLRQDCQERQISILNMYDKHDSGMLCSCKELIPFNQVEKYGNANKSCHLSSDTNRSINIDQVRGETPYQANNIHMVSACAVNKPMSLNFNLYGPLGEVDVNTGSVSGEASHVNRQCGKAVRISQPGCASSQVRGNQICANRICGKQVSDSHINTNQWNQLINMSTNYNTKGDCKSSLSRRVQGEGQKEKRAIGVPNTTQYRQALRRPASQNNTSMGNFNGCPTKEELGITNKHTQMCQQTGKGKGVTTHNEKVAMDTLCRNAQIQGRQQESSVIKSQPNMRNDELASPKKISMGMSMEKCGNHVPRDTCGSINSKKSRTHEMCWSLYEAHGSNEMKNMCGWLTSLTSHGSYFPHKSLERQVSTELEKKKQKILDILFSSKGVPHFVSNKTIDSGRTAMKNEITQLKQDRNKKNSLEKITIDKYSSRDEEKHHESFPLDCENLEGEKKIENCFLYVSRGDGEKVSHGRRKVLSSSSTSTVGSSNSSGHPEEEQQREHQELKPRHLQERGPRGVSDECAYMNGISSQVSAFPRTGTSVELPNDYGTVSEHSSLPMIDVTLQGEFNNKRNVMKDDKGYLNCVSSELSACGEGPPDAGEMFRYGNSNSSGSAMNNSNTKEETKMRTQNDVVLQCDLRGGYSNNGRDVGNISTYANKGVYNIGLLTHGERLITSSDDNPVGEVSMFSASNVPQECSNYIIMNNRSVRCVDGTNVVVCPSNTSNIQGTCNGSNKLGDAICNPLRGDVRGNNPNSNHHNAVLHTKEENLSSKFSFFQGSYVSLTPNCAISESRSSNMGNSSKGYTVNGVTGAGSLSRVRGARNVCDMSRISSMNGVNGVSSIKGVNSVNNVNDISSVNSVNVVNGTNDFSSVNMVNAHFCAKRNPRKDKTQGCETQIKDLIPNSIPNEVKEGEHMRSLNQCESAIMINKGMGRTATPFAFPDNPQRLITFKISNASIHSEGVKCTDGTVMTAFQASDGNFQSDNPIKDNVVKLFNGQGESICKVNNAEVNRLTSSLINSDVRSSNVNPFYKENEPTCEMGKGHMDNVTANNFSNAVSSCTGNDGKTRGTIGASKRNSANRRVQKGRRSTRSRRATFRDATNNAASTTATTASNVTSDGTTPSNTSNHVPKKNKAEEHEREEELHEKLKDLPKITGVSYDKKQKLWVSHWRSNCKTIHKYFSVKKYGFHNARLLAITCRKQNTKYISTDLRFGYKAGRQSRAQPGSQFKTSENCPDENHASGEVIQLTGIVCDKKPSGRSHSIRKIPKGRRKHCQGVDVTLELPKNESAESDTHGVGSQKGDPSNGQLDGANPINVSQNIRHQSSPPLSSGHPSITSQNSAELRNRGCSLPEQSDQGEIYPQKVEGSKDQEQMLKENELVAKCTLKGEASDAYSNSGKMSVPHFLKQQGGCQARRGSGDSVSGNVNSISNGYLNGNLNSSLNGSLNGSLKGIANGIPNSRRSAQNLQEEEECQSVITDKTSQQSKNSAMHTEHGKNEKVEQPNGKKDYLINAQLYNKLMNNELYNKLINNQLSNERVKNNNFYCSLINSKFYIHVVNNKLHAQLERNQREVTKEGSNYFYYGQFKNAASSRRNSFSNSENFASKKLAQDQNAHNLFLRSSSGDGTTSVGTHKTSPPFTNAGITYGEKIITPGQYANNSTSPYSKNDEPPIDGKNNGFLSDSPGLAAETSMGQNYVRVKDNNNLLSCEGFQNGSGSNSSNCDNICSGGHVREEASYFKGSAQVSENNFCLEGASTIESGKKFLSGGTIQFRTTISNNQGSGMDVSTVVRNNLKVKDAMNPYINREGPIGDDGNNTKGGVIGRYVNGRGVNGRGVDGSGVDGSGVNGNGVNGSGVNGSGVNGSGLNGNGVNGSGVNGRCVDDGGVDDGGVDDSGVDDSGVDDGGVLLNRMAAQGRHFFLASTDGSNSNSSNHGSNHESNNRNIRRSDDRDALDEKCTSISNDPLKDTGQFGCSGNFECNNQYAAEFYADGKYHHRSDVDMKRAIVQGGYLLSDRMGDEILNEGHSKVGETKGGRCSHGGSPLGDPNTTNPVNQMDEEKNKLMISKITTKYILTDIKNKCLRNCSSNFLKNFPDIKNVINKHINKISEANSIYTIRPYIQLFSNLLEKRKLLHMLAPNAQELYIYSLQKLPL
ncbi:hypothetical protein C922_00767 [Plasmodium inui San Antonio 1]|uniref:AP2/ERF domain-containing protein n=1 Tax=Plasmodium inui San Antonio 1 TaxID=1237626 RepID=W7ABN0_9APIC|nr:hypothetical protein C922_00767 [Plasmodium inui San Antonio 1]EUD69075.1 hypothetical protein C922_00767 [Plasmodium inui San Antonio 1]